jgi:pimeloyl-ACP methyl ester carboxylesterase
MHGISVDKDEYLGFFREGAEYLRAASINSIRFDFRGHGESGGTPGDFTIVGQNLDVRAIMDFIRSEWGNSVRVHLIGASFGAPPAIFAAARYPDVVDSVTLIAPVLSYRRTFLEPRTDWARDLFSTEKLRKLDTTGRLYLGGRFFIGHHLIEEMRIVRPICALADLKQRVLAIHGDRDSMVPYEITAQTCRAIPHVKFVTLRGADHGFIQEGDDEGVSTESVENKRRIYNMLKEHIRC